MKIYIFLALVAAVTAIPYHRQRRQLEDDKVEERQGLGTSEYHHEFEHEHAKSHQSIKFHHFHPVPVYVKKEHLHLLKEPLEKGKSSHGVKQIHPKTEHNHGYGLVLEHHAYDHGVHGRSDDEGFGHYPEVEHKIAEGGWEGAEGAEEHKAPVYEHHELGEQDQYQYPVFSGYEQHGEGAEESY